MSARVNMNMEDRAGAIRAACRDLEHDEDALFQAARSLFDTWGNRYCGGDACSLPGCTG